METVQDHEPSSVADAAKAAVDAIRKRQSSGKPTECSNNLTSSPGSPEVTTISRVEFAKAVAHLTAMKRTANLDETQLRAWHAALGGFSAQTVNAAVLELALTDNRFPELGDLYQACRTKAIKAGELRLDYNPRAANDEKVTQGEIRSIAARFGLAVK